MKYQFTILASPIITSKILAFMEGTETKIITRLCVEGISELSEDDIIKDLDNKIGSKIPGTDIEVVGYENLVKVLT